MPLDDVGGQVVRRVGHHCDAGQPGSLSSRRGKGARNRCDRVHRLARRACAAGARRRRARDGPRRLARRCARGPRRRARDRRPRRSSGAATGGARRRARLPYRGLDLRMSPEQLRDQRRRHAQRARGMSGGGGRARVHVSSVAAIGPARRGGALDERHLWPGPLGLPFPDSKHAAEVEALRVAARGLDVVPCPAHVFGAGAPATLVDRRRAPLPAAADPGLRRRRDLPSTSRRRRRLLLCDERGAGGERYILGTRNYTWQRLFGELQQISGIEGPPLRLPVPVALALAEAAVRARARLCSRPPRCGRRRTGGPTLGQGAARAGLDDAPARGHRRGDRSLPPGAAGRSALRRASAAAAAGGRPSRARRCCGSGNAPRLSLAHAGLAVSRGETRRGGRCDDDGGLQAYLLTIYGDESGFADVTPEQARQVMAAYEAFGREVTEAGVMLGGEGLQPSDTATTVRVRDGETVTSDGPFADTREQLGGYYLLDCRDLDEISWAAKIPGAQKGTIEVRPVMDYEAAGMSTATRGARGRAMKFTLLLYGDETKWMDMSPEQERRSRWGAPYDRRLTTRAFSSPARLSSHRRGTTVGGRRGRCRRAVRRDARAARRLLRARLQRHRRGRRLGRQGARPRRALALEVRPVWTSRPPWRHRPAASTARHEVVRASAPGR